MSRKRSEIDTGRLSVSEEELLCGSRGCGTQSHRIKDTANISSKTSVHHYDGSNVDLGTAAGRLYRVGVMSIQDGGDSDLLQAQE